MRTIPLASPPAAPTTPTGETRPSATVSAVAETRETPERKSWNVCETRPWFMLVTSAKSTFSEVRVRPERVPETLAPCWDAITSAAALISATC